jgi:hypothetical protein
MTPAQARAHIESAFKSEWGNVTPVDYNNDMQSVPTAPFVRLFVRNGGTAQAQSMNGDLIRYERFGIVFVQIFTALGVGPAPADTLARKALEILEGRQFGHAQNDVLTLGAATQNDIGNNEAGHWQVNVSVPFDYAEYRVRRYV